MKMQRFTIFLFLFTIGAILVAACGGGAAPTPTPRGSASVGKTKFEGTCIACHGPEAKGLPGLGKDLTTSEYAKSTSDVDLVLFMTQGRDPSDPANTTGVAMPPKGGNPALTEDDLFDIVAYLRTLEK